MIIRAGSKANIFGWGLTLMLTAITLQPAMAMPHVEILDSDGSWVIVRTLAEHELGEGDSRIDARELALRKAKFAAAELVGTYLEAQTVVTDARIAAETLTSYVAAFIHAEIVDERLELREGAAVLTVEMRGRVDQASLERKVQNLLNDPEKERRIQALESHNRQLQSLVKQLSDGQQLAHVDASQYLGKRSARRDEVLKQISQLETGIRLEFERGALLKSANQNADTLSNNIEILETDFWTALAALTTVELGTINVRDNGDETVDVLVPVHWSVADRHGLMSVLSNYFTLQSAYQPPYPYTSFIASDVVLVNRKTNSGPGAWSASTEQLFDLGLMSRSVKIELTLGDATQNVLIAGKRYYNDMNRITSPRQQFSNTPTLILLLKSPQQSERSIPDVAGTQTNPLIFPRIPKAALAQLSSIQVKVRLD